MILRNAAVRHGRRSLAPITRTALRQLTTVESPPTTTAEPPIADASSQPEPARRKRRHSGVRVLGDNSTTEHSGRRWTAVQPQADGSPVLTPAQQFAEFQRIQMNTKKIGSELEKRYIPTELIRNPPRPEDVTLELLMASQTHMGHNTSLWNPANARYIHGSRQGIHIISLETTAAHLRRAARVVEEVSYRGGLILFVGTRKNQMEVVSKAAELAGACHLFTRWTPGAITNRDKILQNKATKMVNEKDRTLENFTKYNASARPLVPDLVVCMNPLENYTLLYECGLTSVPTIGVIDTDADPSWVTYTIPANDDSLRSIAVIGGVLGRAGQAGRQRRLADAAKGKVTWSTSPEVQSFIATETSEVMMRRKQVMGQMQEQLAGFSEGESALLNSRHKTKAKKVDHDDMVSLMGEAAKEEETAGAAGTAVEDVEAKVQKMVDDVSALGEAVKAMKAAEEVKE